jgi:aryl carrier-like protein
MRLTLADIDPELAERIRALEAEWGSRILPNPALIMENTLVVIRQRAMARRDFSRLTKYSLLLGAITGLSLFRATVGASRFELLFFIVVIVAGVAGLCLGNRAYQRRVLWDTEPALVEKALSMLSRGRVEKAYADLLHELRKATGAEETAARDVLKQMNTLLAGYRTLEALRLENEKALDNRSPEGLVAELRGLRKRAETATDPQTRDALTQGADLCQQRLESVRALALVQDRIAAQQEVVYQTLASVHAAFARQRVAPRADVSALPPVADISEMVGEVQRRTRAVEAAVEELAVSRHS